MADQATTYEHRLKFNIEQVKVTKDVEVAIVELTAEETRDAVKEFVRNRYALNYREHHLSVVNGSTAGTYIVSVTRDAS